MRRRIISGLLSVAVGLLLLEPAHAGLRVVATTNSLGALVQAVGADQVELRVLAAPDRDTHALDARPSFMAALRRADLLLEVGAGLEEGWLPAAVSGAANPAINSGRPGRFRAADFVPLRPSVTLEGPNMGHVHAEGNPHFTLDPVRMGQLAHALAERLGQLQPDQADVFAERAALVADQLQQQAAQLAAVVSPGQRYLAYHEDLDYLSEWLPVEVVGYLEPVPGVPPSAGHLRGLIERLSGSEGRVLFALFQPERGPRYLQQQLGWSMQAVALEPATPSMASYLALMGQWAEAFSSD